MLSDIMILSLGFWGKETMDNHIAFFAPADDSRVKDKILSRNAATAKHGIVLTESQAAAIAASQTAALKKAGRIEFGFGIADKAISLFADSPYIIPDEYEQTISDLISLFYTFRNEADGILSDDELLNFMKNSFDGRCAGSLELLAQQVSEFSRHLRSGGAPETFEKEGRNL